MKKAVFYIGLGLIPIILLILAQAPLLSVQNEYLKAKEHYALALDTSRVQLGKFSEDLKRDISLMQNLDTDGYSAISRILNGFIKPGQVDYVAILDQNCNIVAHSEQGISLKETCPVDQFTPNLSPFYQWRSIQDNPSLEFLTPLRTPTQKTFFLLTAIHLNNNWLYAFPELRKSFRSRDLVIGQKNDGRNSYVVLEEGTQPAIASLYSTDPLLAVFPQLLRTEPFTLVKPLWAALAFFCLCVYFVFRSIKSREIEIGKAMQIMQDWAGDLTPDANDPPKSKPAKSKGIGRSKPLRFEKPEIMVLDIQERINRMTKRNQDKIEKCQAQNQLLQQQSQALESRLMERQAEQAWFHQAQSLHQQMLNCAGAHMQKLEETCSLGEDLSHLAVHQIARPAQKLYELGSRWDAGLQEMSARKFLRTLSERIDAEGFSELDHSLRFILDQSSEIHNTAVNLTLLSQRLLEDLKINLELAAHWHRMMGGKDGESRSLVDLVSDSQAMIKLQGAAFSLRYENLIDERETYAPPHVASSSMTSAVYHCYLALIEAAKDKAASDVVLLSQLKKRESRHILVLSAKGDWGDELNHDIQLPQKAEQHLILAQQLLQGQPLKLTLLPALQGIQAIALIWEAVEMQSSYRPAGASAYEAESMRT